jgi:molecular chaperone DnaK
VSIALGIDLGTTNTVAAAATASGVEFVLGPRGERVHPSVVAMPNAGGIAIGPDAKLFRLTEPQHVVSSAKRFIGQNFRAPLVQLAMTGVSYKIEEGANQQPIAVLRDRRMTMPEISSQVLLYIKRCAERQFADRVDRAVITVPANFTDAQRQATKEAGRLAGLDVMRLINEPTAAALAYGFGQSLHETICVFDFGGGTLDVSVLRIAGEVIEVLATDGDFFLGGDDIDRTVTEYLAADLNRTQNIDPRSHPTLMTKLSMGAEAIKCHLSEYGAAEGDIDDLDFPGGRVGKLPFRLTRKSFDGMIAGYVDRALQIAKQAMAAAHMPTSEVTRVLCVGGSSRIPLIRTRLAEYFGRAPDVSINPDEVVAQGAAIAAGNLAGTLTAGTGMAEHVGSASPSVRSTKTLGSAVTEMAMIPRPLLLDVNPSTLAIQTAGGFVEVLLEKNAPIPIERTRMFSTVRDSQTKVEIDCCRGEERKFTDNELLGTLVLENLPDKKRGELTIEVTFRVDPDGILHVRARDAASGVEQKAKLAVIGAPVAPEANVVS